LTHTVHQAFLKKERLGRRGWWDILGLAIFACLCAINNETCGRRGGGRGSRKPV